MEQSSNLLWYSLRVSFLVSFGPIWSRVEAGEEPALRPGSILVIHPHSIFLIPFLRPSLYPPPSPIRSCVLVSNPSSQDNYGFMESRAELKENSSLLEFLNLNSSMPLSLSLSMKATKLARKSQGTFSNTLNFTEERPLPKHIT